MASSLDNSYYAEAIIAFFPVKEDHEAIGSIDYPIEVRKKYALLSRKWKCDICGSLQNILPDKKKNRTNSNLSQDGEENTNGLQNNNNNTNNTGAANTNEKDDNKSDASSPLNQRIDSNEISTKIKPKPKLKKNELDRKSHLSHIIEGVIFEDVNEEDIENEDQTDSHLVRFRNESAKELNTENHDRVVIEKEKEFDSNNEFKRYNSDNTNSHTNFAEYLKRLRQTQFEIREEKGKINTIK